MIATPQPESRRQVESPEVELGGRRFPSRWTLPHTLPANRIRTLAAPPDHEALPERLSSQLALQLPWTAAASAATDSQGLVEAYVASLLQLGRFHDDIQRLMAAVCEANLEFRQESGETHHTARDAALTSQRDAMLTEVTCDWLPCRNILNAQLVSQPAAVLRNRLDQELKVAVRQFSTQLFELLARLVDREVIGLVEWLPNNCCSYHFFKRVVIQENDGSSLRVEERRFERITERDRATGRQIVGKRTTTVTRGKGRHVHRFARHQHDVMNAVQTSIRNSQVVMPPHVVGLCQAVPEWLEPFVRVIDGTIFRERIIERDVEVRDWQDIEVHDEPIIGCEPGVIIGPFVLTGWGPREVAAERQRRDTAKREAADTSAGQWATRRYPIVMAAAVALVVLSIGMTFQALATSDSALAAVFLALGAVSCTWFAAIDYAVARRNPHALAWTILTTVAASCQFAVVLWAIIRFYQPVAWWIPAALGVTAIVCHLASARLAERNLTHD